MVGKLAYPRGRANPALNLAPFSRWTLRDKAAQRRLALRWAKWRMPVNVDISLAEVRDAAAILALQKLAYPSEARLYEDWSIPPLTQTLDEIRIEFAGKTFLRACLADDTIVGSVRASLDRGTCGIGRLMVHPEHERRGIGTRLLQAIEALFPAAERFELFTGSQSEGNIKPYTRLGYRVLRTESLSPKVTLVFMEKRP